MYLDFVLQCMYVYVLNYIDSRSNLYKLLVKLYIEHNLTRNLGIEELFNHIYPSLPNSCPSLIGVGYKNECN